MMKVCFLEGDMSRQGGTERMTSILANALSKDYQIWIISLRLKNMNIFFPLDNHVRHRVLTDVSGKTGILKQIAEIHYLIKKEKIDWIINVDVGMSIYGIIAAKGTKAKVITWEHSNFFNNWNSRVFPYFRRFAAKYSDVMVVLTERDRKNYESHVRTNRPVYVIANPVNRHSFNYDKESTIIVSAGLLVPIKSYDRAIHAAAKVLPDYPKWKWIIFGEGPERRNLEQMIMEKKLQNQIFLPGVTDHMDEQYQKAAMFVMTSEMEGLPMVMLEAKSWGLPIVSFDIMTGPSDIVRDGVNGYLVKSYDVGEMAERIKTLIDDSQLRQNFSEHSQMDMEKYEFGNILDQWRKLLQ